MLSDQIVKVEILIDLHVLRSSESENHIFSVWSLCMCVYTCVCVSVIGIIKKQITAEASNSVILHLYHVQLLLETFYKDWSKLCGQGHTKYSNTLWPMDGISLW